MKRLDEIGNTIAPRPLPNFAATMLMIISSPRSYHGDLRVHTFEQRYELDYDLEVDHAQFDSAICIAGKIQQEQNGWLPGGIYAIRNKDLRQRESSYFGFLTNEWPQGHYGCLEYPRVMRFNFELLKQEPIRNALREALHDEAVRRWDSVVIQFYREPCTDTSTFTLGVLPMEDDTTEFGFALVPHDPDTVDNKLRVSPEERADSIVISSFLHDVRGLREPDTIVYRVGQYIGDMFREPYLAAQDARLRAIGFAKGCERRLISHFLHRDTKDTSVWGAWRKASPFKGFEKCLPENADQAWQQMRWG